MSYQVLALKYRPQTFGDVVGQGHVTTTLTNAISASRVAHALLFTGPRGTGKTTIARILAKAMACSQGPTPVPCNQCKICRDITSGHCADVFEIDGASNNSVDQIRELRENVTYMPASARVKIYIIDEVHMLSTAAFNALLKTLEEPPGHVIFIFATTEVHKIPATILSRCQRHDLSRISLDQISGHLGQLCEKEGFILDRESLDLIAMEADGSIRDSLSLLDRVLSASPEKTIRPETVRKNLGVMDRQLMADLTCAIFERRGGHLIDTVDRVNDAGHDLKHFYSDLILHFRNLNIIKLCGASNQALNLTGAEKEQLGRTVAAVPENYLGLMLQMLLENESLVRHASHTKTALEMVLLKMIQINPGIQLDSIITKLDALARQMDTHLSTLPSQAGPKQAAPEKATPPQAAPPGTAPPMEPPGRTETPPPYGRISDPAAQPPVSQGAPASAPVRNLNWAQFLEKIQDSLPFIYALLSRGQAKSAPDKVTVTLELRSDFEKGRLKSKNAELQALSRQYLGKPIAFDILEETQKNETAGEEKRAAEKARHEASMHPLVQETRRIFDGEIIL